MSSDTVDKIEDEDVAALSANRLTEMRMVIQLTQADVECLLRHIRPESGLKKRLGTTDTRPVELPIDSSQPVNCSEAEAYELLRVANERCAAAVQKIKEGIILSGT